MKRGDPHNSEREGEGAARPYGEAVRARAWAHDESERDACAIIANVKKDGRASHGNVKGMLEALARMGHRTGEVEGEGDGAGLQTDIPRERWARRLEAEGLRGTLVTRAQFTVAHLMIPHERRPEAEAIKRRARALFEESVFEVLVAETARVRTEALGPSARAAEPEFWQVAALPRTARGLEDRDIFHLTLKLERELPVHVVSLSPNSVIYKVRGDAEALRRYFPELSHPDFKSAITLGHGRYSTNTDSRAERADVLHARPQRRDKLHRPSGTGGALARLPAPASRQRFAGARPRRRELHVRLRPEPDERAGSRLPARLERGRAVPGRASGALPLLAPRLRRARAGPRGHHRAAGRRNRLQLRRAGPPAALVRRDGEGVLRLFGEGRRAALRRRLATGARVSIGPASESDEAPLRELLGHYAAALAESQQHAESEEVARLADCWRERFVKVVPAPAK